ncbi:MAG: M24 family metallopeptidase [Acidimicrobiales bacterium]
MTVDLATLPPMDFAARVRRLRHTLMAEAECEALLVTNLINVRYLTGFTGSAARLLVLPDEVLFVTDGRYQDQSAEELAAAGVEARIEIGRTAAAQKETIATAGKGLARLALEADNVTWAQQRTFAEEWFEGAELVPTEGLIANLRMVKDDGEGARIAAACAIADAALANVGHRLFERPTESEFALELEVEMRRLGGEGPSFETIVGSGPNGAKPHATAGPRRIDEGDLVVLDFGSIVDGYHSDMTRTFMVGEPSATQQRMMEVVAEAQAAGVAAVRDGAGCVEVDAAGRDIIDAAGWAEEFLHSTGHGVGLYIHEDPRISYSADADATLAAGYVVTIEPGVYLPEHGGVRIEDTVVVTSHGCRVLTNAPKDPAWPSRPTT